MRWMWLQMYSGLECGARPAASPGSGAGLPAQHGDWPWHVSLHREGRHVCDGTLVHTKWVVSTKSCFQGSVLLKHIFQI